MRTPLPIEFVARMRCELGESEAERLFAALDTEPATSIRLNPFKPVSTYDGEQVGWCRWGRYLAERPQFTFDPLLHAGAYYVQEASSQFVAHLLSDIDIEGGRVLDMCAAPGGKTTIYSTLVGRSGLVVANDINHSRTLALADNVQRWGLGNVVVTCNEPAHIGSFEEWFDVVAVDAPCSGEGMFRKMDEARSEWSVASVEQCVVRQREILTEAWRALRPGGRLIYSTCTFNAAEDEGVVEWLVKEYGDDILPVADVVVDESWGVVSSRIGAFQCFHFYPHRAKGEGFFAAVAMKREAKVRRVTPRARRRVFGPLAAADNKVAIKWFKEPANVALRMVGDTIYAYSAENFEDVMAMSESLSVVYSGVAVGQVFKGRLKPDHALSLYVGLNDDAVASAELSEEEAVEYLRRGEVAASKFEDGINVVRYRAMPIGFVKRIGARCNNMYPKDLRIIKTL